MLKSSFGLPAAAGVPVWQVGALCHAVADALEARFNPVAVSGELTGFSRAASGHCYFSLRDTQGQIRCAMFRRAASLLDFTPRDGERVEVRGRLTVYEPRGDLQLVAESMVRAGAGTLFEEFLRLKAQLEGEGLFDPARKRPLPVLPRGIGLVTSLGAAALHDVVTALQRRAPHVPVVLAPAAVQGAAAPRELIAALSNLYQMSEEGQKPGAKNIPKIDLILLVRGGGALEDLWAFNDEQLARTIVRSPVPVVSGVGHETDFTIADFVADLRAPTPTAAAELAAQPRDAWLGALDQLSGRLGDACLRTLDRQAQRLDRVAARLGRPSSLVARQQQQLARQGQRMGYAVRAAVEREQARLSLWGSALPAGVQAHGRHSAERLARAALRLELLDPRLVLQRGYAWLTDAEGQAVTRAAQTRPGQALRATLHDGAVDLQVLPPHRG
ncbi:MAG TPA: exodeoxyribonuclease VII large subunit [Burkholderiaceae bacterium]